MSTATHHPSEDTLAEFYAGTLDEGRRLVVAAHMELCSSCRRMERALDEAGGDWLDGLQPVAMSDGALQGVLARIDRASRSQKLRAASRSDLPIDIGALRPYALGQWRWIGPGVRQCSVEVSAPGAARVFLLKAAPGTALPHHAHDGTELTVILKGAFRHAGGRYGVGDCDEADESVEHNPIVEEGEECICLVAMQGNIRLLSWIGRLIQPFVRL
jgi:putative transcriptional regulator